MKSCMTKSLPIKTKNAGTGDSSGHDSFSASGPQLPGQSGSANWDDHSDIFKRGDNAD